MDEIHQFHGAAAAYIVQCNGNLPLRGFLEQLRHSLDDIVDIGEIPRKIAVVEDVYRLPGKNGFGKEYRRHIRPPPGPVHREKAQSRQRNMVKMGIHMRDKLVAAFRRGIDRNGSIDGIVLAEGRLFIAAVDGT